MLLFLAQLVAVTFPSFGNAHEVRPAYLEIAEAANGGVHIRWKQPVLGDYALSIAPRLSSGWLAAEPIARDVTSDALILEWQIEPPHRALAGQTLTIEGLARTQTEVLVNVSFAGGAKLSAIVKPDHPELALAEPGRSSYPIAVYLRLGIEHILTGPDHLLFVFALILLVRRTMSLIKTITAFTVAHSITLACATMNIINVPPAPVEAVIALSIVFVAVELVHMRLGRPGLIERGPWVVTFLFGLLHGFGFAGALREVGLPHGDVPLALLLFNCGIEAGQLLFVACVLLGLWFLNRVAATVSEGVRLASPYAVGGIASFWLIERLTALF